MNIPKKFEMSDDMGCTWLVERLWDGSYNWEIIANKHRWNIGIKGNEFSEAEVSMWLKVYRITKIYEEERFMANGVDANGSPFNFTPDMLKPFMRVVTRDGDTYMVVMPWKSGEVCLAREEGHIGWYNPSQNTDQIPFVAEEVYDAPSAYKSLNLEEKGELIWKRQEVKPVDESINKRMEWLQVHIDAVKENMESLQKEYNELKQAVK